jgi:hypothetical protein
MVSISFEDFRGCFEGHGESTGLYLSAGEDLFLSAPGTENGQTFAPKLMGQAKGCRDICLSGGRRHVDGF